MVKQIEQNWIDLMMQFRKGLINSNTLDHLGTELLLQLDALQIAVEDPLRKERKRVIQEIYADLSTISSV